MASSSWATFAKTVLIPMLIALTLYVLIFLITIPIYRRYRSNIARYSNYTPLSSNLAQQTTSLFSPYLIEPSKTLIQKIRDRLSGAMYRLVVPSMWARERDARFAERVADEEDLNGGLFDAESGEAMVGFDIHANNLSRNGRAGRYIRRAGRERRGRANEPGVGRESGMNLVEERARGRQEGNMGDATDGEGVDDSNRRLSRELEEGFRDDSGSDASDEEVTVGRRAASRRRNEART